MEKVEKAAPTKEEPVAVPNHTEKIRSQSSYYLTVADTGEILDSNPPLAKLCSPA